MSSASKILIVEDEFIIAASLKRILEDDLKCDCRIATTGQTAIRMAEELKPDILIMDVGLPGGIGGVEAARTIRDKHSAPIIFMTGYSLENITAQEDLAPSVVLTKPTTDEKIKETVLRLLS